MANKKFETLAAKAAENKDKRDKSVKETEAPASEASENVTAGGEETAKVETSTLTPAPKKQSAAVPAKVETRGRKARPGEQDRPSAAKGCKPGYERHGYVLPTKMLDEIHNLAKYFGKNESAMTEILIQKGIDEAKAKHGDSVVKARKEKSVF